MFNVIKNMDNVQKVYKVAYKDFGFCRLLVFAQWVCSKIQKLLAHVLIEFAKAIEFGVIKFRQESVH